MDKLERKKPAGNLREQIMKAALRVFGERGYERSTTKAIAQEAGVAEGTIFNYFPTKKDILLSFWEEEAVTPLPGVLRDSSLSDLEIVKNFFRNRLELLRENQPILKVMISESLFNTDLAEKFQKRIFEPSIKEITNFILGRTEAGAFKKLDSSIVARSLVSTIIWFGLIQGTIASENPSIDDEAVVDTLATLFLKGIEAQTTDNIAPKEGGL